MKCIRIAKMAQIENKFALMDMGPRCVNIILFFVFDFLSLVLFYCCDFMVSTWTGNTSISSVSSLLCSLWWVTVQDFYNSHQLKVDLVSSHMHPLRNLEKTRAIIGLHFQSPLSQNSTIAHLPGLLSIKSYSTYYRFAFLFPKVIPNFWLAKFTVLFSVEPLFCIA